LKKLELNEIFELGADQYCIAEYDEKLILCPVDEDGVILEENEL